MYGMLQAYRSTNHQASKMTPYYLLMNRGVRTRLEHFPTETMQYSRDEQIWAPNKAKKHVENEQRGDRKTWEQTQEPKTIWALHYIIKTIDDEFLQKI